MEEEGTEDDNEQMPTDCRREDSDVDRNYRTMESDIAEDISDSSDELEDDDRHEVDKENDDDDNPNRRRASLSAMRHTMQEAIGAMGNMLKRMKKSRSNNSSINATSSEHTAGEEV